MFRLANKKTRQLETQDIHKCTKQLGVDFKCFDFVLDHHAEIVDLEDSFTDYWFIDIHNRVIGFIADDDATLFKLSMEDVRQTTIQPRKIHKPTIYKWSLAFLQRMIEKSRKTGYVNFNNHSYTRGHLETELAAKKVILAKRRKEYNALEEKLEGVRTQNILKVYKRERLQFWYNNDYHVMIAGKSISLEDVKIILDVREHVEPKA